MATIPASCDTCGLLFGSTNLIGGSGRFILSGNKVSCPNCGSMANVLDGVYGIMGDVVRVISAPAYSATKLRALADALTQAKQQNASAQEITATLKQHVPELNTLGDFVPKTRAELFAFLAVLVAAIALILNQRSNITPEHVQTIVDKAVEKCVQPPKNPTTQKPNRAQRRTQASKARHK